MTHTHRPHKIDEAINIFAFNTQKGMHIIDSLV